MRSATAPDISVVAVPINPSSKTKRAVTKVLSLWNPNNDVPTTPLALEPNMSPKPKSQKSAADTKKVTKFLMATLIEFFARTKPVSSAVNPACMMRTNAAQTSTQAISTGSAVTAELEAMTTVVYAMGTLFDVKSI